MEYYTKLVYELLFIYIRIYHRFLCISYILTNFYVLLTMYQVQLKYFYILTFLILQQLCLTDMEAEIPSLSDLPKMMCLVCG